MGATHISIYSIFLHSPLAAVSQLSSGADDHKRHSQQEGNGRLIGLRFGKRGGLRFGKRGSSEEEEAAVAGADDDEASVAAKRVRWGKRGWWKRGAENAEAEKRHYQLKRGAGGGRYYWG